MSVKYITFEEKDLKLDTQIQEPELSLHISWWYQAYKNTLSELF